MMEDEYIGVDFYEFAAETEVQAKQFVEQLTAKGYDVEQPFHAKQGTDGRFGANGFDGMPEAWTVSVYIDGTVDGEIVAAMARIAEALSLQDWGCEPSTSFDHGDRDASISAHL